MSCPLCVSSGHQSLVQSCHNGGLFQQLSFTHQCHVLTTDVSLLCHHAAYLGPIVPFLPTSSLVAVGRALYPLAVAIAATAGGRARSASMVGGASVAGVGAPSVASDASRGRSDSLASDITVTFGVRVRFRRVRRALEDAPPAPLRLSQDAVELLLLVCLAMNWRARRAAVLEHGFGSPQSDAVALPDDYVESFAASAGAYVAVCACAAVCVCSCVCV